MTDVGRCSRTASSELGAVRVVEGDQRGAAQQRVRGEGDAPRCDCGSAVMTRAPGATTSLPIRKRGPATLDACVWMTGFGRPVVPEECRIDTGSSSSWRKRLASGSTPAGGAGRSSADSRPAHAVQRARAPRRRARSRRSAVGVDADGRRSAGTARRRGGRRPAVDQHADRADAAPARSSAPSRRTSRRPRSRRGRAGPRPASRYQTDQLCGERVELEQAELGEHAAGRRCRSPAAPGWTNGMLGVRVGGDGGLQHVAAAAAGSARRWRAARLVSASGAVAVVMGSGLAFDVRSLHGAERGARPKVARDRGPRRGRGRRASRGRASRARRAREARLVAAGRSTSASRRTPSASAARARAARGLAACTSQYVSGCAGRRSGRAAPAA